MYVMTQERMTQLPPNAMHNKACGGGCAGALYDVVHMNIEPTLGQIMPTSVHMHTYNCTTTHRIVWADILI